MKTSSKVPPVDFVSRKRALLFVCGLLLVIAAGVIFLMGPAKDAPVIDGNLGSHQQTLGHKARPEERESPSAHSRRNAMPVGPNGLQEKEQMISDILSSGRPINQMADDLLALLPECEGATQSLAVSHLTHLVDESQIDQLLQQLGNPKINQASKEEIFSSIYQRDPDEAAALLIQVIEMGNSKFVSEAERALVILLAANHGNDVAAWRSELESKKKLREVE